MTESAQTLRSLIDKAKVKQGVKSTNALEPIARRHHYRISHTTLSAIYAGTYPSVPSKATLEALAFLAGVPFREAHRAAGLGEPRPPFAAQAERAGADKLNAKHRNVVLAVIRALAEAQQGNPAAEQPNDVIAYLTDADIEFDEPDHHRESNHA